MTESTPIQNEQRAQNLEMPEVRRFAAVFSPSRLFPEQVFYSRTIFSIGQLTRKAYRYPDIPKISKEIIIKQTSLYVRVILGNPQFEGKSSSFQIHRSCHQTGFQTVFRDISEVLILFVAPLGHLVLRR